MPKNSFLHKIIYGFGVWITPIVLILTSLFVNLPNADLHKRTLRSSNFYSEISSEIRNKEITTADLNKGFSSILFSAILSDLATPGWIQNFFEQNIDLITNWLKDGNQESDLVLYIPAQEIEISTSKKINEKTEEINQKFADQIPQCSQDDESKIKREGFDLEQNLCLPSSVKSGEDTLLEFLNINQSDTDNTNVLDKIVNNNALNNLNENFKAEEVLSLNPVQRNFLDFINRFREIYLWFNALIPILIILTLILLIADLSLAKFADHKKISYEIRRYFYAIAIGTFSTSVLIILVFGGFVYLNNWIQSIFLSGLSSQNVTTLLAIEAIKFSFNLLSYAIWISLGLIIFNLIFKFLETSGFLSDVKKKNQKLNAVTSSVNKNPTLDGEFQRARNQQKSEFQEYPKASVEPTSNSNINLFQVDGMKKMNQNSFNQEQASSLDEFENMQNRSTDDILNSDPNQIKEDNPFDSRNIRNHTNQNYNREGVENDFIDQNNNSKPNQ